MSSAQYEQYKNLFIFAVEWRGYKAISQQQTEEAFRKDMQANKYIKIDFINDKSGKPVLIYLLADNTDDSKTKSNKNTSYSTSTQNLKRLLARIKDPSDVILVSKEPLKTYAQRAIRSFSYLRVKTYLCENFNLVIPNGPLCYPHRILSFNEVNRLLNDELCCKLINLPKMVSDDVQCIWIGAEVGDVIKIDMLSDTALRCVQYKVVVPKNGSIVNFRVEEKKEEENSDEDEDIIEHRENVANEVENDDDADDADDADDDVADSTDAE